MIKMILFEWLPFRKKWTFYLALLIFFCLGLMVAKAANFPFPDVYRNSPYIISYVIALFSQISIFSVTILAAQVLLREQDANFQQVLYATPVKKNQLLLARFYIITGLAILLFFLFVAGMMAGHSLPWLNKDELTAFNPWHYLHPFLLFGLLNTIFCSALICLLGWISKNKLMIYLSGLFVYILYIVGAVFSNSPLMANASPASDEAMQVAAKFDPFGLAALFEQTKYWLPAQRNTELLRLSGNLLVNRLIWFMVSIVCIAGGIKIFKFNALNKKRRNKGSLLPAHEKITYSFKAVPTHINSSRHYRQTIVSFIKIDLKSIVKGIPFILLCLLWIFVLGMEIYGTIEGGIRLPERYVTTGLTVNTILKTVPFFCLMAILFYSSELVWRSKNVNIDSLEKSTAMNGTMYFISKLISLSVIPVFLTVLSILTGIAFQLLYQYPVIDVSLYSWLFYLLTLPMILCLAIIISIQVMFKNKYAGIAAATLFVLLTNTSIGSMIGLTNPLFRIANSYPGTYSEMNGFGKYVQSFSATMLYATAIAVCCLLIPGCLQDEHKKNVFKKLAAAKASRFFLLPVLLLAVTPGVYLFYQSNVLHKKLTKEEQQQWQHDYENIYRRYAQIPQPIINNVATNIDLYPEENRYDVSGSYWLQNKTSEPMDSFLIYLDKDCTLKSLRTAAAKLVTTDQSSGHYLFAFNKPLPPSDSFKLDFSFSYKWSAFKGHRSFNAIIENGSFMRISNYFPVPGYQADNELEDEKLRRERNLPTATPISKLEDPTDKNHFIQLSMNISTSGNQTAIAVGDLVKQWKKDGRNYFQYTSSNPVPFRFAVSSAQYAIKKDSYKGKPLEVYYHPAHGENVDALIESAKRTLDYCEKNFSPYPFNSIRFAEVSSFTKGFAATAYPATVFMTEDMVFHTNINKSKTANVIGELSAHELAHQWWGGTILQPSYKEGRSLLTETLAMYTELMLNKQVSDSEAIINSVKMYKGLYFSERGFSKEKPLYRTTSDQLLISYYKGLVVMYQLQQLIGEEKINTALHTLILKHSYPMLPATSTDLLNELYAVSLASQHKMIDELFRNIVTHEAKINSASVNAINKDEYELNVDATVLKFMEADGKKTTIAQQDSIDIAVYSGDDKKLIYRYAVVNEKITGKLRLPFKPVKIEMDPYIKLLDPFDEDNTKMLK